MNDVVELKVVLKRKHYEKLKEKYPELYPNRLATMFLIGAAGLPTEDLDPKQVATVNSYVEKLRTKLNYSKEIRYLDFIADKGQVTTTEFAHEFKISKAYAYRLLEELPNIKTKRLKKGYRGQPRVWYLDSTNQLSEELP